MSVQEILNLKSSKQLTFEKQLEFKQRGRPKPELNLIQTTRSEGKDIDRHFQQTHYNLTEWICGCDTLNAYFCFPCLLFSNDYLWTKKGFQNIKEIKETVEKHNSSGAHLNATVSFAILGCGEVKEQFRAEYQQSIDEYNKQVTRNRYMLERFIDCIIFAGGANYSLRDKEYYSDDEDEPVVAPNAVKGLINVIAGLDVTFKEYLEESELFKNISDDIQNEILDAIFIFYQARIINEIEQADFVAIQVDKVDHISSQAHLVLILRYVLKDKICERFWKFLNPLTPEEYAKELLQELEILKLHLTPEKLISQSYDGSLKMHNVQKKIQAVYKYAKVFNSYAHQLHLVVQKACNERKINYFFYQLRQFSSFFSGNQDRLNALDEVAELLKPGPENWCFEAKCVETVYNHQSDLLVCLEKINETRYSWDCSRLIDSLEDDEFIYWLDFFNLVMPHVEELGEKLQKPNIEISTIPDFLTRFVKDLEELRDSLRLIKPEPEAALSNKRKYQPQRPKLFLAIEACDAIVSEIKNRFSFNSHLLISQLLSPEKFEQFSSEFPRAIWNSCEIYFPFIKSAKLKSELKIIYQREEFYDCDNSVGILRLFYSMNLLEAFSETAKLLKLMLTIPMTTFENQRVFETLKKVEAFLRDGDGREEQLNCLAVLRLENDVIKNVANFNELVIEHLAKYSERIHLRFKTG